MSSSWLATTAEDVATEEEEEGAVGEAGTVVEAAV